MEDEDSREPSIIGVIYPLPDVVTEHNPLILHPDLFVIVNTSRSDIIFVVDQQAIVWRKLFRLALLGFCAVLDNWF